MRSFKLLSGGGAYKSSRRARSAIDFSEGYIFFVREKYFGQLRELKHF